MLNEKMVIRMTRTAIREEKDRSCLSVSRFTRWDYMWLQMMKTLVASVLSFCIMAGVILLYWIQKSETAVNPDQLIVFAIAAGGGLLLWLILHLTITWIVYGRRYEVAVRKKENLERLLLHLEHANEKEPENQ